MALHGYTLRLNFIANAILTLASVAPVLFVYASLAAFEGELLPASILAVIGFGLIPICLFMFRYARNNLERTSFRATTVEVADKENLGILILYMVPLLRTSFSELDCLFLIPAIAIFLSFAVTGYGYHFNPLLNMLNWHFYKVGTNEGVIYVLITKKQLRNATDPIIVVQLTKYTLIDLEGS